MTSPSDLLKKANTTEYVIHTQAGTQFYKNPAYYMQPPTANASVWSGDPPRTQWRASAQDHRPQPFSSPQSAPETPAPYAPAPRATVSYAPGSASSDYSSVPNGSPPMNGDTIIRPPEIPRQYIAQKPSFYAELMKKHDRLGPRHLN